MILLSLQLEILANYDPIDFKDHPTVVPGSDGPKSVHSNQQLAQLVNGPYQGLKWPILKNLSGGKIFHSQLSLGPPPVALESFHFSGEKLT